MNRSLAIGAAIAIIMATTPFNLPMAKGSSPHLDPEGTVLPFQEGDRLAWRIPNDNFGLYMVGGRTGAWVNLSDAHTNSIDPVVHLKPNHQASYHFSYADGDVRSIKVVNGTGVVAVIRSDLMANFTPSADPRVQTANATLEPGACVMYIYSMSFDKEPTLLLGRGQDVRFRVYSPTFEVQKQASNGFNRTLDPDKVGFVYIQGCNPSANATLHASFAAIYPAPKELWPSQSPANGPVPGFGFATAGIAVVMVALVLRNRDRREP